VTVPEPPSTPASGPIADPNPLSGGGSVPPAGADSESIFDDLLAALSKSSATSAETDPSSPSFESLFEAEEPEGPAPAVVAVMVAHNPGGWFEETLSSLGAQDYSALSVLVIDAASTDGVELRDRVGEVLPDAHLRRLPENSGYAAAANEALVAVQGAAFYLFCHDDVRLDPDAVRLLVEEAFRSNAGIVGPKLVEWSEPRRLLSVGMGADRFGHPAAYVERGDLDQEQHDAVRDVFFIPGAVTLIRADLFEALGGFDSAISFHGEDLELCWRAHVAGARVIVAPAARVAHLEALGIRRPVDDRRRLQARHRLRAMRDSDTLGTRVRATPEALILSLLEIVQALVLGHFRRARDIWSAWTWNSRNSSSARTRRASLAAIRRVPDSEVHAFQSRGSARLTAFMRHRIARSEAAAGGRELMSNLRDARSATPFVIWVLMIAFLFAGGRELVLHGVPAVGDFVRLLPPGQMVERWLSGYQSVGLGSTAPAPTGFGFLGALSYLFFGAIGLLRGVLILGLWPLGVLGMWRLTQPVTSQRSRLLASIVYLIIPVAANGMAQGQWGTLVLYALLPWVVSQLASASGLAPFGTIGNQAGPGVRSRPLLHRTLSVGLFVALGAVIDPSVIVVVAGVSIAFAVGGWVAGQFAGSGRILLVGVGGSAVALVLHLPWSLGFLDGWDSLVGVSSNGGFALGLADVLRFGTGPFGTGILGWLLLVTALLPLFIGRQWRLSWAVRSWVLALVGFGLAWGVGQGWLTEYLPSPSMLLVPSALGVALAAGLGMAAFEIDLPDYHFGWRQIVSLLAAGSFIVALGPALMSSFSGRWDMPRGDFNRSLSFLGDGTTDGAYRVLWLGDATALPLQGWALDAPAVDDLGPDRTLAYATTISGTPSIAEQWAGSDSGATSNLARALQTASEGGTARLGALLSPMAVRYVVVPVAPAPDPYARSRASVPTDLLAVLDAQLDLASITVNPGVRVYRNSAWAPGVTELPSETQLPNGGPSLADRTDLALQGSTAVLTDSSGFAEYKGELPGAGEVYVASAGEDWQLKVDGQSLQRNSAFGWSSSFTATNGGVATLSFETPATRGALLAGQVVLWILAVVYLLRVRVREDERTDLLPVVPAEPAVEVGTETVVESMALVDAVMLEEFADFGAETVAVETVAVDVAVDVNLAVDEAIEVESQVPEEPQVGSMSPEESEAFWKTGRRGLRRKSK
jgi:GT2 family glycosyltransferase